MRCQVLGSGSGGNALLVRAGEISVLVDAGLPLDELERRLEEARVPARRLDALLLTHGHLDHARSAGALARKADATVFCAERLMRNHAVRRAPRFVTLRPGTEASVNARRGEDRLRIHSAPVPHDASPTYAFRLEHGEKSLLHVTDMGHVPPSLPPAFLDPDLALIEFNHDRTLLAEGPYPRALKRRVGGDQGHLSNDQASRLLDRLRGPRLHTVVLTHLSRTNNRPGLARSAARRGLGPEAEAVRLEVASQDEVGPSLPV